MGKRGRLQATGVGTAQAWRQQPRMT
jgi:hypothetical protein